MGTLILLLVLAFVGWATFTQISARRQTSVSCPYDVATAKAVVAKCFGRSWASVAGKGDLNYQPRLRQRAPVISVSFDAAERGGSEVDIWCSHFTKRYGLLEHGQLVWRKKRAVARALGQAALGSSQASAQALSRGTLPVESPRTQSGAQPTVEVPSQTSQVWAKLDQDNEQPSGRHARPAPRHQQDESLTTKASCAHTLGSHMEFGEIKVKGDPPYQYREFWHVTACTNCGKETHRETDEYYGDDMADIHWKWRH